MTERAMQALKNAAASFAVEGLIMEQRHFDIICRIMDGEMTLEEYFQSMKEAEHESVDTAQQDKYTER